MKFIFGWILILIPSLVLAHKDIGNGGDLRSLNFQETAYRILNHLEMKPIEGIDLEGLRKAVKETSVDSTDEVLLLNGVQKDAVNFPSLKKIIFNRQAWDSLSNHSRRVAFVFHEYLGILGVDDSRYQISHRLAGLVFFIQGFDARLLMSIVGENGMIKEYAVSVDCQQSLKETPVEGYRCFLRSRSNFVDFVRLEGRQARELWTLLLQFRDRSCSLSSCSISIAQIRCLNARRNVSKIDTCYAVDGVSL